MKKYTQIAIKIAIVGAIALLINTEIGQKYADKLLPLVEMVLQQ